MYPMWKLLPPLRNPSWILVCDSHRKLPACSFNSVTQRSGKPKHLSLASSWTCQLSLPSAHLVTGIQKDPKAQTAEPMSLGALFPGCHSFEKDLVKVIFAFSKIHLHWVYKSVIFSQLAILKLSPQSNFRAFPSPQYNPLNPSAVSSHSHTKPWATLIYSVSL